MPGTLRDDGERGVGRHPSADARQPSGGGAPDRGHSGVQRGGLGRSRGREIRSRRSRLRDRRRRRRLDRPHRRGGAAAGARSCSGSRSTSASAARCRPDTSTRWRTGFDLAVQVDGDGQHDPGEIAGCSSRSSDDRADMVVGTRFAEGGGYRGTPLRRIGIHLFAAIVSLIVRAAGHGHRPPVSAPSTARRSGSSPPTTRTTTRRSRRRSCSRATGCA